MSAPDDFTAEQLADLQQIANGGPPQTAPADWLTGAAMDPAAEQAEPLPTTPGFPFLHKSAAAVIVGPTGGGRSSLVQAAAYDAARAGVRVAYLGGEVTEPEFNARAADLANRRGDPIDDALREQLASVRYLNLASSLTQAWRHVDRWAREAVERFEVIVIDPLSAVASALGLDFDRSNAEFVRFYDRLVQPLAAAGAAIVMLDNLGHSLDARSRAKGASAKQDRADLTFSCKLKAQPVGLVITAQKVRTVRAPFARGATWTFDRETQRIQASGESSEDPTWKPTVLMARVARAVKDNPGLSKRALRETVTGDNRTLDLALELLVAEGYVETRPGEGRATCHHAAREYAEEAAK